ncbi:hypothetical protein L226DRAFT_609502 [Lentinus tigrinus ALCF2SS1-7]|uniref:Uncharacterized protein n=1 Tax=Lentinus tigrinus ALCF2SS1-6 TaxID=1328759 RepID=A0A5C2SPD2_9APHY|nr:hypothetical protein L227DRAFT_649719 [Lentinus tigrinus ALCF2SS1-6]RPD78902.1 hypothetical protein L226DRAFT_609502 [Lentinus tigrinus ALCF2SS1-7]
MAKRPRDVFDTPSSSSPPLPPSKRLTMAATKPPTFTSTFPIPRSPWAFSVPHDSPSNPFGLDRNLQALALPRSSGFGKHIVLRMQLVSQIESRSRSRRPEAPYRIVQVPLNYSFRLLHELVLFLFASDSHLRVRRRRRVFSPSLYPHQPPPPPRKPKLEVFGESPKKEEGHLFEVMNDVSVYASTYRPGVIKPGSGKLYARLSSKRDRKLFRNGCRDSDDEEDGDVFGNTSSKPTVEEDDDEGWVWEAEDDFLLSNIWTDGPDLKKAIVYYHTQSTAIHITVNQVRVPPRKGTGNTPFVFSALGGTHGAVRISNIVSGHMPSEEDIKENMEVKPAGSRRGKNKSAKETGKTLKAFLALTDDDYDEVDDLDDGEEADDDQLERWNSHDAFHRFLAREAARERAMRRRADVERDVLQSPAPTTRANVLLPASPANKSSSSSTHIYASRVPQPSYYAQPGASSSSTSLSVAPSSPSTLPVLLPSSDFDGDAEAWSDLDFDTDPNPSSEADGESSCASSSSLTRKHVYEIELPLQTPYPANPAVRRRVGRMCKRIERQTSKGLSELSDEEEEEEQKDELVSSQESKASQEVKREECGQAEDSEDATARQPVPVVASRGPDLFAEVYGDEPGHEPEPEEDSDDEGWENAPLIFDDDDYSEDELDL